MVININQNKIAIGDKYKIYFGDQLSHRANNGIARLMSKITLQEVNGAASVTIKRKFNWFKARYEITHNGEVFMFETEVLWRRSFICKSQTSTYYLYGHQGRKASIYKGDNQIAYFDKSDVTWFEGDNYQLIADDDADINLMISFVLIWDNFYHRNRDNSVMEIDLGHIGAEAKKFDPSWKPTLNEEKH